MISGYKVITGPRKLRYNHSIRNEKKRERRGRNMIYTGTYQSPLGGILLAADEIGLTGLWFEGQKYFAHTLTGSRFPRKLQFLLRQKNGWISISQEKNRTLYRRFIQQAPRSGRQCGSFCWRFLMGRRLPMERLQDGWRPCRTLLPCQPRP